MSRNHQPPTFLIRILHAFLHEDYVEDIEGDLHEKFDRVANAKSLTRAKWYFLFDLIKLLRPGLLRPLFQTQKLIFMDMFKHNLVISYRTILRNKTNSIINIGGLTLGMAVAITIGLWVNDELTFNQNHTNYEHLAKVLRQGERSDGLIDTDQSMVPGLGGVLRSDYGNYFEAVGMVRQRIEYRVISRDRSKFTQSGYFVQREIPKMLTLDMKHGSVDGLSDMNNIMISETLATKLFGEENPVGEIIEMDARWSLTVTGVYRDLPENSEFKAATYMATLDRYVEGWTSLNIWDNYFIAVYVQKKETADFTEISEVISQAMVPHLEGDREAPSIFVHPMSQWHLYSNFEDGILKMSLRMKYVLAYSLIGIFVLLLACINFANLSTVRSQERIKEIGIRKSMGSQRSQLISQFLSESFVIGFVGLLISLGLVVITLPWFNDLADKDLSIPFSDAWFWLIILLFTFMTSLIAGSYPAFHLSALKIVKSLQGERAKSGRSSWSNGFIRKLLVVFQFTISISLIIGTLIIYEQTQLAKKRPVGYQREHMITLRQQSPEYYEKYDVLTTRLRESQYVDEVGSSNYEITSSLGWNGGFDWENRDQDFNPAFNTIRISRTYPKTVGLEFVEGDQNTVASGEQFAVIINESALDLMKLPNPIGSKIYFDRDWFGSDNFTIVGVVKDMIKGSPFEDTDPSIMFLSNRPMSSLFIRLKPNINNHLALTDIADVFEKIVPSAAFDYQFADAAYGEKFKAEERIGELSKYFAFITIIISSLGLFGLSSYTTERRTKEIGIRKVLGATSANLWRMLSKDYMILILFACLVAIPVSSYFLSGWLDGYEIRVELGWHVFAVAGLGALAVTIATVSYQTLKASMRNPVESLRNE